MPLLASGKFGTVDGEKHVRNWTLNDIMTPETYRTSATRGGQFENDGVEDWNGSFEGFGGQPVNLPGEIFTFKGFTAPTDGNHGTTGPTYTGSAIVDQLVITWNFQAGQSLGWTLNFSAASAGLTEDSEIITDATLAVPQKMCGLVVDYGAALAEIPWPNVQQLVLTITADNQSYVNSSTNCFTHRKPGTLNYTVALTEEEAEQVVAKKSRIRMRAFVDATTFWLMDGIKLQDYSNLSVSAETGAIISKVANFIMSGSDGTALGSLAAPDGTVVWP